ncbi:MAG: NAD-binding protein [Bacteroidetes bacterium]|nr:NAD-binding protein [Bacteroidota bacterium]
MRPILSTVEQFMKQSLADPGRKFRFALCLLVLLVTVGSVGFMAIEKTSVVDAFYMAVTTITTVGFGEVHPFSPEGRVFVIGYIVLGVGAAAWAFATGAEMLLGDKLWASVRQRRMKQTLMKLEDHYIICGFGRLGRPIITDMRSRGEQFVVVENNGAKEERLLDAVVPFVIGDATQEEVLLRAGLLRARGIVITLDNDAENVLAVLTARELNPKILIVARANSESAESKLRRAGADRVISLDTIAGRRLALATLQPKVHDFLERVFSLEQLEANIDELRVAAGSPLVGQLIGECDLRSRWNVTVLAVQNPNGEFIVSPDAARAIEPGETLIVMGSRLATRDAIAALTR